MSKTSAICFFVQHNMKHVAEPLVRRNITHYPTELPKLNMVVPGPQISFPVSTMPAFTVTHRGTLPAIITKKCQTRLTKVNTVVLHRRRAYYSYIFKFSNCIIKNQSVFKMLALL